MKLVFLSRTPLAGMPWRTMKVLDKQLRREGSGWARCISALDRYGPSRSYPCDVMESDEEAQMVLSEADLCIVPSYGQDNIPGHPNLPVVRHYSTEHFRWKEKTPASGTATVVAQYQARFAPQLKVLPNCIPIDEPTWTPSAKPTDRCVIVYTPTSRATKGWGSKGYHETIEALRQISTTYRDRVQVLVLEGKPYEEVMAVRRRAHIVIDECKTGSYHSTALEGLACGAVSVCWVDRKTEDALVKCMGPEAFEFGLPFFQTGIREIRERIGLLIDNPDLIEMHGRAGREWMERWYSEEWQASTWIKWHRNYLKNFAKRAAV